METHASDTMLNEASSSRVDGNRLPSNEFGGRLGCPPTDNNNNHISPTTTHCDICKLQAQEKKREFVEQLSYETSASWVSNSMDGEDGVIYCNREGGVLCNQL